MYNKCQVAYNIYIFYIEATHLEIAYKIKKLAL